MREVLGGALLQCMAVCAAWAQSSPPDLTPGALPGAADDIDRVVVIGRSSEQGLRDYASDFVNEVAKPVGAGSNFGFARWEGEVCIGVENIAQDAAQFIADRVSLIALELGLTPGVPGCEPNISIVFATEGATLAQQMAESEPRLFRPFDNTGGTTQGRHSLEEFLRSSAPVRWWQVTMVVDWAGNVAIETPQIRRTPPPPRCPAQICVNGAGSRITNGVRDELWMALLIVDVSKLDGATWSQLADYLSMVSLVQINSSADLMGYDTILNLFENDSRVVGLTDWDWTYLRSLYEFERHRVPEQQRMAITREMIRQESIRD